MSLSAEVHSHHRDGELLQYVLKREYAEGAIYMTMLPFPHEAWLSAQTGPDALYRRAPHLTLALGKAMTAMSCECENYLSVNAEQE